MEYIYKLRYKTNGLFIGHNPLGQSTLILSEDADIYRTFEQIPQQIKLSCGTQLTRNELEVVKFAVIPHEIVELPESQIDKLSELLNSATLPDRVTMSKKAFDYLSQSPSFKDLLKSAAENKNKWLAEQDKM